MYVGDESCTMCVLSVCTDSSFLLIKCTKQRSTFCLFWATFGKPLAFFKGGRGFDEPGTSYREQIQLVVRVGLEPGASELQVQPSYRLATLPPRKHLTNLESIF